MDNLEFATTTFQNELRIEITVERRALVSSTPMVRGVLFDDRGVKIQYTSLLVEYEGDADLEPSKSTFVVVHTNNLQGKLFLTRF